MDQDVELLDLELRWCAVLCPCSAETLGNLGVSAATLAALTARGWLLPPDSQQGDRTLVAPVRRAVFDRMRRETPRLEADLHGRAAAYFTDQLLRAAEPSPRMAAESACLTHLAALHDLFVESMEWTAIFAYTSRLDQLQPPRRRVASWVEYFAAYADLRGDRVWQGLDRLDRLLADDDLEPGLRLRALHASHIGQIALSRYDRAMELLREAHGLARRLGDRARRSYVLLSISQIYNDLYDYRRALRLSQLSLRLARAEGATYREAHALYEVGNSAMQLGRWEEAAAALDQVETIFRQLGMTRRLAMVCWAQGMIALAQGAYARGEAVLRAGLVIAQAENAHNALTAMDILAQLGLLSQVQGDDAAALGYFRAAIDLTLTHQIAHWRPILRARVAAILARAGQSAAAEAEWRAALVEVETIREGLTSEDVRVSLFGTTPYVYETLVLFLLGQGRLAEAFTIVERARSRAFLDLLSAQGSEIDLGGARAAPAPEVATLAQIQRRLGAGDVLIEYFCTSLRPGGDHWMNAVPRHNRALLRATLAPPTTLAFAVTRDSIELLQLRDAPGGPQASPGQREPAPDLDANKLWPSAHSDDPILDMLRIESQVIWLSQRLLAPLEPHIQGRRRVYIIPHGPLHYVPFGALRRGDGRHLLDADGPALVFAPSASVLLHALQGRPAAPGRPSLAIGYDGPDSRRLDHAEREAAVVAGLIGGAVWAGPAPKSARLLGRGERLRWLHIAGHTIFDAQRPQNAGLHLGAGDTLNAAQIMRAAGTICRADLVTLSACMSGYSQVLAGDEIFGLQRAFLATVAPTVICTLARARDSVALLVMEQLYNRMLADARLGPAEALRDALVAVRQMTRAEAGAALARHGYAPLLDGGSPDDRPFAQPEFWAPFVVIGRPGR